MTCGICSGPLRLRYEGDPPELVADAFAPSNHSVSGYADLYACERCGTVQQPDLPTGAELHDLYRDMRDDAYLAEENGRRRTAQRLLDAIERHAPRGRMLEVGCGHGLLLDEARARGWSVEGLELAAESREHARSLGLDVRDQTLEDAEGEYGAVVLADVLEHLDDPVGALGKIAQLLAPGGVTLIVTPDPASRTARLAGPRWWGYLPSHTYLIPHSTLRKLLRDAGLATVEERHFWRTFSLGYWIAGLGERSTPVQGVLKAVDRAGLAKRPFTFTLGDERVVVARRAATGGRPPAAP
jgi:2-polyprenyl-3-methyl-5-hydroxy-6-metoxy-1,4-benzoquinol methylase